MKSKLYSLLIAFTVIGAVSCKTASKMYEKGNYDEAVELAAKKLQKDPTDVKFLNIIKNSYRYAVNDHEDKIREHSTSNSELKWEWMYNDYVALQKMYDAIAKVPSVFELVRPQEYRSYLATYGDKAADVRFNRGLSFMQRFDKQSYRNAYREFQAAANFKPGDREITEKMREAYEYAVTNVIVLPMQQYGGYVYGSYTLGGNNLDDELLRNLKFNTGNDFLKFYSAWDARAGNVRADMIMDMQLSTVNIGHYHDHQTTRKVSKEVVVREIVIRPDSIVREYATVYANITTTGRTMRSDAMLRVNVKDAEGHWLWSDHFNAEHNWSTEFASYTGDARALSSSDKALIERRQEYPPAESEVMRCLLEKINNDAVYRIRNYFSRLN